MDGSPCRRRRRCSWTSAWHTKNENTTATSTTASQPLCKPANTYVRARARERASAYGSSAKHMVPSADAFADAGTSRTCVSSSIQRWLQRAHPCRVLTVRIHLVSDGHGSTGCHVCVLCISRRNEHSVSRGERTCCRGEKVLRGDAMRTIVRLLASLVLPDCAATGPSRRASGCLPLSYICGAFVLQRRPAMVCGGRWCCGALHRPAGAPSPPRS